MKSNNHMSRLIRKFLPAVFAYLTLSFVGSGALAQSGQWQVSDDGNAKWQYLNTSRIGLSSVHIADFNGDGRDDVFRGNGSDWYTSYSGTNVWTKTARSAYTVGSLRFGDFNGDGQTDVFRSSGGRWYVSYSATGPWTQINTSDIGVGNLAIGDFNGDGRDDVFYGNGTIWRVSYSGTGRWQQINRSSYATGSLGFADFNGDGRTDVLRTTGSKWYISYSGSGSWTHVNNSSIRLSSMRFGDFNGDGRDDIFRGNGSAWYVSDSATTRWRQINSSSRTASHVTLGDFKGDGRADVFYPGWAKLYDPSTRRHTSTSFTNAQASDMYARAELVIKTRDDATDDVACRVEIERGSNVETFSEGNGSITSSGRLNTAFRAPGNVKIVNTMDYCAGAFNTGTVGCGKMGSANQILERGLAISINGGKLYAHERGHNSGLDHTNRTHHIMRQGYDHNKNRMTASYCQSYKDP